MMKMLIPSTIIIKRRNGFILHTIFKYLVIFPLLQEAHINFDDAYPLGVDIMMMLLGGFGFLMTFLKRYGLSSLGFTMIITVIVTQFSLIVFGLIKMDPAMEFAIKIGFIDIIEAGLIGGAVLISFGVIIGKVNPLQLLFMALLESIFCVINLYIGYNILGVVDVGGSIFIHTFGAYFGLAVSFCLRFYEHQILFSIKSQHNK